ncbi:MAG: hypothetical protein KC505_09845, partial [Myxococcales bacterium]|nr:hypothetical protein [Myxococcales bacterium]
NTFLREDSDAITGIVDFLFNAHASKNLINEIREINFSNYLFFSEIKKKNISKCEKKIYQLLFDLKKIFSRNIEKQKTLQRLFFSLHSISTHALRGNGAIAEERILSLIFLRFINVILQKFSDEQEAQARINLIKCLQRTISGESEKGGELGLLNKFFAGTNSKGKKTQALLKELQKIFYSAL